MHDKHEPNNEFVEKLEWQIGLEVRRRNRSAQPPQWTVIGLMLLSMGIGASVVAAAYQAQGNERRDVLTSGLERRAELARQSLTLSNEQLQATQRQVSLGTASQESVLEARVKVAEAEAQVKSIALEIEEIRITAREPLSEISAPLVSGRDFVSERLRIGIPVPQAALDLERLRLQNTQKRVSLGVADVIEVDASRVRTIEIEAAIEAFRKKIEIRQQFLNRKMDAVETELRVLEIEAEQRMRTLAPKFELARKASERANVKVQLGTGQRVDQMEAMLQVQVLAAESARAELELVRIRRQLEQLRTRR